MSEVYEAETPDGRRIAVKVFRDEAKSRFLRDRFMAEARLLKTLYHPNIVRVHDCGIDCETGSAWFAMDLALGVDGNPCTLASVGSRVPRDRPGRAVATRPPLGCVSAQVCANMIYYRPLSNCRNIPQVFSADHAAGMFSFARRHPLKKRAE